MKKIFYIAIAVLGLTMTSCSEDLMETYAPGALTEEVALQTVDDVQLLLNTAYTGLTSRTQSEFVSIFTDEVGIGFANGGQGVNDDYVFFLTPQSSGPAAIWGNNYASLARINRVLISADKIVPADANEQARLDKIKAEALTLRAYCHLTILSYFTPNMKDPNALAGIISNRIFVADDNDYPRNTNAEFYNFIHSDLTNAITLFNSLPPAPFSSVYASKTFAQGLKARAYAYAGDYTNAEIWADTVINTSGLTLSTYANYPSVFLNESNPSNVEVIFKFKRTINQNSQGSNLHNAWYNGNPTTAGAPYYEISRALFNKLNPSDTRYRTMVSPVSVIDANYATSPDVRESDKLLINKHGGTLTGTTTWAQTADNAPNNDIKIMRLAEMYLIKAEARVDAGDLPGAAAAVKTLLDKRYNIVQPAPTYATATAAWKGILDERRIEFAFEGYRFIDLKRLGSLANSGIDRDPADYQSMTANYPGGNPSNLPLTSHKWALPIPASETNVNSAIQQNIGY
ncbi:RagB/SusD family nutrient uptake outer membrane protein [uncultured Chryseobacterium sp.]|jgi:SusD family.|uniref:RagB/SusD family nutrient uptake outer membrane protein n=1 Tax=uncultured Chryseobacterium sp. TaxID=259322 RepID=UPI00260620C2|nr:RagB/SusD family nutrient uptake outer membrane protein [uncultured Chryseobacterium sp.]